MRTLVLPVLAVVAGVVSFTSPCCLPLIPGYLSYVSALRLGMIALGLAMAGVLRIPFLSRERRFDLGRLPIGPKAAFPMGMAFAFGWAPCIGPVLSTILATAAATQTVAWGGALLALYSAGLGLPFIGLALGFRHLKGSLAWLRRHGRAIEILGGLLLVGVGTLFATGEWRRFFIPLQRQFVRLGWLPV